MNITKTGKTQTENILSIVKKLDKKQKIAFQEQAKSFGYGKLFAIYIEYENNFNDSKAKKTLEKTDKDFTKLQKDLYKNLVTFIGKNLRKNSEKWETIEKILNETDALYDLELYSQAHVHLQEAHKIIEDHKKKFASDTIFRLRKEFYLINRFYCLKTEINYKLAYQKPIPEGSSEKLILEINDFIATLETMNDPNYSSDNGRKELFEQFSSLNTSKIYVFKLLSKIATDVKEYDLANLYFKKAIQISENEHFAKKVVSLQSGHLDNFFQTRLDDVMLIILRIEQVYNHFNNNPRTNTSEVVFDCSELAQFVINEPNTYTKALFSFILVCFGEKIQKELPIEYFGIYDKQTNQITEKYFFDAKKANNFALRLEYNQLIILMLSDNYNEANEIIEHLQHQKQAEKIKEYQDEINFLGLITDCETGKVLHEKFGQFKIYDSSKNLLFDKLKALFKDFCSKDAYLLQSIDMNRLNEIMQLIDPNNPFHNLIIAWFDKFSSN